MASSSPASIAVRGTIESTSRYSAGEWSLPPIGPRPSSVGTPMPDVVFASDAPPVAVSLHREPSRRATAWACSTRRPLRASFSIGCQATITCGSTEVPSISVVATRSVIALLHLGQALGARGPDVDFDLAALGDDVGPRAAGDLADVHGHARPAAVERVQLADDPRGLEDRVAALLRLDPGVGGPAVDGQARVEDALAGRHDVAVGAGTLEDQARIDVRGRFADVGHRRRRADLLIRVGDERQALEGQAAELADDRLERVETGEQPRLHVGDAGAVGVAVVDPERALGRGPGVEHGVHVADEQDPRAVGHALERADDRVAELPAGSGRMSISAPEIGQEAARSSDRPRSRLRACTSRSRC